jgi:tetratricopeptide (TPR) repeat protein
MKEGNKEDGRCLLSGFILHPFQARGRANMSANDVKVVGQTSPRTGRRRGRLRRVLGAAVAGLVLAAGGLLWVRFSRGGPVPPEVDLTGVDPGLAAAVQSAQQAVREAPTSAKAWGRLGMVLVVHEYRVPGSFCFEQAQRLEPREVRWPYFDALGCLSVGDHAGALPRLEQAVALCHDQVDGPRLRLGEVLLRLNRPDEAEPHFHRLLAANPDHARARLGLARIALQRGQPQTALLYLELPQRDRRTCKAACLLLAEVHQRLGNTAEAAAANHRAAELPDDLPWPDPLYKEITAVRVGRVLWIQDAHRLALEGQNREAIDLLRRVVRDYPDAADAWHLLGLVLLQEKQAQEAEQAFRRASELEPGSPQYVSYRGVALMLLGDLPAATVCFRKAVELQPDFAPALINLGKCLSAAGDRLGALDAYRAAVRSRPELFEARLALGTLLAEQKQYPEALVHARQAVKLDPPSRQAQDLVERIEKELGPTGTPR